MGVKNLLFPKTLLFLYRTGTDITDTSVAPDEMDREGKGGSADRKARASSLAGVRIDGAVGWFGHWSPC
jgi:hypothetical protein